MNMRADPQDFTKAQTVNSNFSKPYYVTSARY
jgi:hypothetical protein